MAMTSCDLVGVRECLLTTWTPDRVCALEIHRQGSSRPNLFRIEAFEQRLAARSFLARIPGTTCTLTPSQLRCLPRTAWLSHALNKRLREPLQFGRTCMPLCKQSQARCRHLLRQDEDWRSQRIDPIRRDGTPGQRRPQVGRGEA